MKKENELKLNEYIEKAKNLEKDNEEMKKKLEENKKIIENNELLIQNNSRENSDNFAKRESWKRKRTYYVNLYTFSFDK